MNVKLSNIQKLTLSEILTFEKKTGFKLSVELHDFLLKYNGCEPECNIFKVSATNDSGVSEFIPLSQVCDERKYLDGIEKDTIPIAWADGGNYVIVKLSENGAVYFWDHEVPLESFKLEDNIIDFIQSLEPFDIDSIELKEGQVKSVWVDPDFLKSLDDS